MKTHFTYSQKESVANITMVSEQNKPAVLDQKVLSELESCIDQALEENPRMVFLRSSSERFFCVGANINVLKDIDEISITPWVKLGHRILNKLEDLPMPIIAVVKGYAMGGGLELALACDLIFASDKARFAQSEAGLGFIPGWGGTRRLAERIGNSKAKYYFFSGRMIGADRAEKIGLVDFVSDEESLEKEVRDFSEAVIRNSRNALIQFKTIGDEQYLERRRINEELESQCSQSCLKDPETQQRLHDFLSKKGKK